MNWIQYNSIAALLFLIVVATPGEVRSQTNQAKMSPTASQLETKHKLVNMSKQIQSPGFAQVVDLPPDAVDLARQLDALAIDLRAAWLVRGLDSIPLPSDMAERLSTKETNMQNKIVADLTIIFELLLPSKSSNLTPQELSGREARLTNSGQLQGPHNQNVAVNIERDQQINYYVQDNVSLIFQFLERDRLQQVTNSTPDQLVLSHRLDLVARSVLRHWGEKNLRITEGVGNWSPRAERLRQAVSDHSESILFGAILEAGQGEKLKRAYWTIRGLRSLLEPELASRLGINKAQRKLIDEALKNSADATRDLRAKLRSLPKAPGNEEVRALKSKYNELINETARASEQGVWDLLTPRQISMIKQMLGDKALRTAPPRQEKASTRSAHAS